MLCTAEQSLLCTACHKFSVQRTGATSKSEDSDSSRTGVKLRRQSAPHRHMQQSLVSHLRCLVLEYLYARRSPGTHDPRLHVTSAPQCNPGQRLAVNGAAGTPQNSGQLMQAAPQLHSSMADLPTPVMADLQHAWG